MRLIDADALMEYTRNQKSRTIDCNDIARFPTAFNKDEVIKNLVNNTKCIRDEDNKLRQVVYIAQAVDIVGRGGVND